jgi:hypothetical protein
MEESPMKTGSRVPLTTLLVGAFTVALISAPARGDVIMDWNARADAIGIEKQVPNAPTHAPRQCSMSQCLRR